MGLEPTNVLLPKQVSLPLDYVPEIGWQDSDLRRAASKAAVLPLNYTRTQRWLGAELNRRCLGSSDRRSTN